MPFYQRETGSFDSHVRAGAHGDANIHRRQGRGVVHAVPGHRDLFALLLQLANDAGLVFGQHVCTGLIDTQTVGNCLRQGPPS